VNKEMAEELTQAVGQSTSGAWRTITALKTLGVPKALGLTDEEWLKKYLGNYVQLAVAQRYDAATAAKAAGLSQRAIARAANTPESTLRRHLRAGPQKPERKPRKQTTDAPKTAQPLTELAAVTITAEQQAASAKERAKAKRDDERDARAARPASAMPPGLFRLLYADPPWRYEHVVTESRAIENQYPTMSLDEICALHVPAADDAVLFLWATSPKLAEAMQVIDRWGFTYRTCAVWDKDAIGMGYYFRQQHELLLVAARGASVVPPASARPSSVLRARRGRHSEKPAFMYDLLEMMFPDFNERDRVELFQREPRSGWSGWGNESAVAS
jgi:N6-adenosine-specific RNA methylase IME4